MKAALTLACILSIAAFTPADAKHKDGKGAVLACPEHWRDGPKPDKNKRSGRGSSSGGYADGFNGGKHTR